MEPTFYLEDAAGNDFALPVTFRPLNATPRPALRADRPPGSSVQFFLGDGLLEPGFYALGGLMLATSAAQHLDDLRNLDLWLEKVVSLKAVVGDDTYRLALSTTAARRGFRVRRSSGGRSNISLVSLYLAASSLEWTDLATGENAGAIL